MKRISTIAVLFWSLLLAECGEEEEPTIKCLKCTGSPDIYVGEEKDPSIPSVGKFIESTLRSMVRTHNKYELKSCVVE